MSANGVRGRSRPRWRWIAYKLAYFAGCGVAAVLAVKFLDGVALAVGLTVVAFFAGGSIEVVGMRYADYCREWETANLR